MITKKKLPQAISAVLSIPTLCLGMGFALVSTGAHATTWQYVGGNSSYNTQSGQPNTLTDLSSKYPSDLLQRVINRLPEGGIAGYVPVAPAMITDDTGANLVLRAAANVKVSYVFEGAGYNNSVGFFKFNKADLPTLAKSAVQDKIMFPNFSDNVLQTGKAVDLGDFVANDAIGFTIVANGWKNGVVDPGKSADNIFRTIKRFNTESANKQGHTVLFSDPAHELLILAFEDLHRETNSFNDGSYTTDDDFNDVVIAIHVTPFSAVDPNCLQPLVLPAPTPVTNCGLPLTTSPLPAAALTNGGRKVNICHFPPGNTTNVQKINISVNSLDTHLDHHNDTLRINGVCEATVCSTTTTTTTAPTIPVAVGGVCTPITPTTTPAPPAPVGDNGPISWREITVTQ